MKKTFPSKGKSFSFFAVNWAEMEIHSAGALLQNRHFYLCREKKSLYRLSILFSYRKDLFLRRILPVSCST